MPIDAIDGTGMSWNHTFLDEYDLQEMSLQQSKQGLPMPAAYTYLHTYLGASSISGRIPDGDIAIACCTGQDIPG